MIPGVREDRLARARRADVEGVCAAGDPLKAVPGRITDEDIKRVLCLIVANSGVRDVADIRAVQASALESAHRCEASIAGVEAARRETAGSFLALLPILTEAARESSHKQKDCGPRAVIQGIVSALGNDFGFVPIIEPWNDVTVFKDGSAFAAASPRLALQSHETAPGALAGRSDNIIAVLNKNVLYARLPVIGMGVSKFFEAAAKKARSESSIIATIIDLRGSQGGRIDDIVRFVDLFFDDGILLQWRMRANGRTETERATRNPPARLDPTIVLIDEQTASGSEAVAASFRKSSRAMILGRKSMGLANITTTAFLPSKSLLRFPTGDLLESDIGPITGHGVMPDVEFADSTPPQSMGKDDRMLAAAYAILIGSPSGTRHDLIVTAQHIVETYREPHRSGVTSEDAHQ
jgi:hypothetical protein